MLQPAFQQVALVEVEATEAGIREIGSSGLRLLRAGGFGGWGLWEFLLQGLVDLAQLPAKLGCCCPSVRN